MDIGTRRWWTVAGGGLVLVAFFTLPLLGPLTGRQIADRLEAWWLVPAAAAALLVLGCWRGPVSLPRRGWIIGVAAGAALDHVLALMALRRPAGAAAVYHDGVDPAGVIGAGYWVSLAGFVVTAASAVLAVRARPVLAGAIAGLLLGTVVGSAVLDVRQDNARQVVVLLAASATGEAAFARDVVAGPEATERGRIRGTVAGDHEDLFGGTWQQEGCERGKIGSLVAEGPASWLSAASRGAERVPADARRFIGGLTPVRLRADVLVTAYGFAGDRAYPYHAVLQTGTAVLVDRRGVPRARCAGAVPLAPPGEPGADYQGPRWEGFDPAALVTITPAPDDVRQFGMKGDVRSFRRPAGTDGGGDVALVAEQALIDGTYALQGKKIACNLGACADETDLTVTISGCPDRCTATSDKWIGTPVVADSAGSLTVSGALVREFQCRGKKEATTFVLTLRAKTGGLVAGMWTAEQVEGEYQNYSPVTACTEGVLTWAVSGTLR